MDETCCPPPKIAVTAPTISVMAMTVKTRVWNELCFMTDLSPIKSV